MSDWSRRGVLRGLAAVPLVGGAMAGGCRDAGPKLPPLTGGFLGLELAERGHRVWKGVDGSEVSGGAAALERTGVAIVGGGIAGLTAAWRLRRAGYPGAITLLELGDQLGGTAAKGTGPSGLSPLGAHYLTLPSPECTHMRVLLDDLGLVEAWEGGGPFDGGRPRYPASALCLAPQERLFVAGRWIEGLWPEGLASPEDDAQKATFEGLVEAWTARVGADGRPAFAIPVAKSSADPELRALAEVSFAAWLDAQGLSSPVLRWFLRYATRDDYGTELADTSAWAGLHYFCSRRPDPADAQDLGTQVLTWPEGNGRLVDLLTERLAGGLDLRCPAVVRSLDPDTGELLYDQDGSLKRLQADAIVAAVPARVLDLLLRGSQAARPEGLRPDQAPWWVGQLHLDAQPVGTGVSHAWDSVVYEAQGLGVVSSAHQSGGYGGPTVLSWYNPLSTLSPSEGRRRLLEASWEEVVDMALSELSMGYPELRRHLLRVDVQLWGHGTTRPVPGLHALRPDGGSDLADCAAPVGRVFPAHSDLSGLSLFEEASYHGVRAAEAVLAEFGAPVERSFL